MLRCGSFWSSRLRLELERAGRSQVRGRAGPRQGQAQLPEHTLAAMGGWRCGGGPRFGRATARCGCGTKTGGMASNTRAAGEANAHPLRGRTPLCAPRRLLLAPQCRARPTLSCLDLLPAGIRHLRHGLSSSLHVPPLHGHERHRPQLRGRSHTPGFCDLAHARLRPPSGVVLTPPK